MVVTTAPPLLSSTKELQTVDPNVHILSPCGRRKEVLAEALEAFATFVLETPACFDILQQQLGQSVGELQGGTEHHEIYRVSISVSVDADENDSTVANTAAYQWLYLFHASTFGAKYKSVLTFVKLKDYMISKCRERYDKIQELANFMFILAFGPTHGQVRHIDRMDPNLQVCCYMSKECPSTMIYQSSSSSLYDSEQDLMRIRTVCDLLEHWSESANDPPPELLTTILMQHAETDLSKSRHTAYLGWKTIRNQLEIFGKLYVPVERVVYATVDPGTVLIAGGDPIHAGPPTTTARMFCFGIGIVDDAHDHLIGEIQYNPVMLHIDLMCIVCSILKHVGSYDDAKQQQQTKRYLMERLVELVRQYPHETYERLIADDRSNLREWLGDVVECLSQQHTMSEALIQRALTDDTILAVPILETKRKSRKKRR